MIRNPQACSGTDDATLSFCRCSVKVGVVRSGRKRMSRRNPKKFSAVCGYYSHGSQRTIVRIARLRFGVTIVIGARFTILSELEGVNVYMSLEIPFGPSDNRSEDIPGAIGDHWVLLHYSIGEARPGGSFEFRLSDNELIQSTLILHSLFELPHPRKVTKNDSIIIYGRAIIKPIVSWYLIESAVS